jgi:hypothetical protein
VANSGGLLEKARHHRQKIIHPQAYASAYNRHVSMVRDAHWQFNDPNFHPFSSGLPPRQLLAAVVIVLWLVVLWLVGALVTEQQTSRRVGVTDSWIIARAKVYISQTSPSQASLRQPQLQPLGTQRTLDTALDTAIAPVARADAPSTSTQNTTSTSPKITNLESNTKKSAHMMTSAASSAGLLMFVTTVFVTVFITVSITVVACPCT